MLERDRSSLDDATIPLRRTIPMRVAGALVGACAGVALGAMVGVEGVAWGFVIGLGFGAVSGHAIAKEERRRVQRTRELDAIIGVTEGTLGVPPASLRLPRPDTAWLAEWLTPPPPPARVE